MVNEELGFKEIANAGKAAIFFQFDKHGANLSPNDIKDLSEALIILS